jgi:hypothetical protein
MKLAKLSNKRLLLYAAKHGIIGLVTKQAFRNLAVYKLTTTKKDSIWLSVNIVEALQMQVVRVLKALPNIMW